MTTLTLVSPAAVTTDVGEVIFVSVLVNDDTIPLFRSADGRRMAASKDDLDVWNGSWVTTTRGQFPIQITAGNAAPVLVVVTVTDDGPAAPEDYGDGLLNQAIGARDDAFDARTAAEVAQASAETSRTGAQAARDQATIERVAAQAARDQAYELVIADLGVTDNQAAALFDGRTSAASAAIRRRLARAGLSHGKRLRAAAAAKARQTSRVVPGALLPIATVSAMATDLGAATIVAATDLVTTTGAHGLTVGEVVSFVGTSGGSGIANGTLYYVKTVPSSTTFTFSATSGGATFNVVADTASTATYKGRPIGQQMWKAGLSTVTLTAATDLFTTPTAHGRHVGEIITLSANTAGGAANDTRYWIKSVPSPTTFTVSATNTTGTTLDITSDGTATLNGTNPLYSFSEGRPQQSTTGIPQDVLVKPDTRTVAFLPGTYTGTALSGHTVFEGDKIDGLFFNSGIGSVRVYEDGVLIDTVTSAQLTAAGITAGNSARKLYPFPEARRRTMTQVTDDAVPLYGFAPPQFKPIAPPTPADLIFGPRVIVPSDSYGEGTGVVSGRGLLRHTADLMGWNDLWRSASGGTGIKADGARSALEDRYLTDVVAQNPDVVIYALGLNDESFTAAAVAAALATVIDAVATAVPFVEQIVVGPWSPKGFVYAPTIRKEIDAALQVVAESRGLRFISPLQEDWITGNGKVGATTGNGNSDIYISSDGTHPNDAGHEYLGWRLAGALATLNL